MQEKLQARKEKEKSKWDNKKKLCCSSINNISNKMKTYLTRQQEKQKEESSFQNEQEAKKCRPTTSFCDEKASTVQEQEFKLF